jgi:hypothetical protein
MGAPLADVVCKHPLPSLILVTDLLTVGSGHMNLSWV